MSSLTFFPYYKPCHIPFKCRCTTKTSDHICSHTIDMAYKLVDAIDEQAKITNVVVKIHWGNLSKNEHFQLYTQFSNDIMHMISMRWLVMPCWGCSHFSHNFVRLYGCVISYQSKGSLSPYIYNVAKKTILALF